MKKILCTILSSALVMILFCSCAGHMEKSSITVNRISLDKYSLVYDSNSVYSKFAAENMKDYIKQKYNVTLAVHSDIEPESKYEILLGDTLRFGSNEDSSYGLNIDEYKVKSLGKKILLIAEGYMIGGAVRGFLDICESTSLSGNKLNVKIKNEVTEKYKYRSAKSSLLFIGDGMGENHIHWARSEGMEKFFAHDMPYQCMSITYSYSVKPMGEKEFTDSAAAATALATGFKTLNGVVGMDHELNPVQNIRELAQSNGAKTAVLTTDSKYGATPAAFTVHAKDRFDQNSIDTQIQLLEENEYITLYKGELGDGLLSESKSALNTLSENESSFFMMIEEGQIDLSSHSNDKDGMIIALNRFNLCIANAMQFTLIRGDVLLIVTADHETGGITEKDGAFSFTSTDHTNSDVCIFAMGSGAEFFDGKRIENVLIPHKIAKIFGDETFGSLDYNE